MEVVEQVKKNMGEFLRIENREAFPQMVFSIAGCGEEGLKDQLV